jgi:hypothetical protein
MNYLILHIYNFNLYFKNIKQECFSNIIKNWKVNFRVNYELKVNFNKKIE